jgi:anhydro-N-acetylmuramic acid kinase
MAFESLLNKPVRHIVGLMSGTSADGIDAVLCAIQGFGKECRAKVLHMSTVDYPEHIHAALVGKPWDMKAADVARLSFLLGQMLADAALKCINEAGFEPEDVDLISSHGQTIAHFPDTDHPLFPVAATLQIGDLSVIAKRSGILTAGDFRPADMAVGGEGAPLVPYVDWILLGDPVKGRIVQNIGGIGNLTYLPPKSTLCFDNDACGDLEGVDRDSVGSSVGSIHNGRTGSLDGISKGDARRPGSDVAAGTCSSTDSDVNGTRCSLDDVIAFDTGPGNMMVDMLAAIISDSRQIMDKDAEMAEAGALDAELLETLLKEPYYAAPPPKSTGRELFGQDYINRILEAARPKTLQDYLNVIRTVSELTVRSMVDSYLKWVFPRGPVHEVIVGGGGAQNPYFMRRLREELPGIGVLTHDQVGISSKAKEALAFAILGNELLGGVPNNVPGATGASRRTIMGKVAFP